MVLYNIDSRTYSLSERQLKILTILLGYLVALLVEKALHALINSLAPKKKELLKGDDKNTIPISKEEIKKTIPVYMVASGQTGLIALYLKLKRKKTPSSDLNDIRGGDIDELHIRMILNEIIQRNFLEEILRVYVSLLLISINQLADTIDQSEAVRNQQPLREDKFFRRIAEFLDPSRSKKIAIQCIKPSDLYYVNNRELVKKIIQVLQKALKVSFIEKDVLAITPALYSLIVMDSTFFKVRAENTLFNVQNHIADFTQHIIDRVGRRATVVSFSTKRQLIRIFIGTFVSRMSIPYGLPAVKRIVKYFFPAQIAKNELGLVLSDENKAISKSIINSIEQTRAGQAVLNFCKFSAKRTFFLIKHYDLIILIFLLTAFAFEPVYSCSQFVTAYVPTEIIIPSTEKQQCTTERVFLDIPQDEKYLKNLQDLPSVIVTSFPEVTIDNQKRMKPKEAEIINKDWFNPTGVIQSDFPRDVRKIKTSNLEILRTGDDAKDFKIYGKIMDFQISIPLQKSEKNLLQELKDRRDNTNRSNTSREKKSPVKVKAHKFNTKIHTMKDWDKNENKNDNKYFDFDSGDIIDLDSETILDVPFKEIKMKEDLKEKINDSE